MLDKIDLIPYDQAVRLIKHCHYAKIMPRITRFCVGGMVKNRLVGVCTLGYGVRPFSPGVRRPFKILKLKKGEK